MIRLAFRLHNCSLAFISLPEAIAQDLNLQFQSPEIQQLRQESQDIEFSAKELCRNMASPKRSSMATLKHLARYLLSQPAVEIS